MTPEPTSEGWPQWAPYGSSVFPPEFSANAYRSFNPDLRDLTDAELEAHYERDGRAHGRQAHGPFGRAAIKELARSAPSALVLGPDGARLLAGSDGGLSAVPALGDPVGSTDADLAILDGQLDLVFGDQLLPYLPDLAGHLVQVERWLRPGGVFVLAIPDKRFGRDHFRPESTIADAMAALVSRPTEPSLGTTIADIVLRTHDDPEQHWQGHHGVPMRADADGLFDAMQTFDAATSGGAPSVRRTWVFTPSSFRDVLRLLNAAGVTDLYPLRVYDTLAGSGEFFAVLQRGRRAGPIDDDQRLDAVAAFAVRGWSTVGVGAFVAKEALIDPSVSLTLADPIAIPSRVRLALATQRIETLRLAFVTMAGYRHEAWFNVYQPHLIDHPFAYCAVTADPTAGTIVIDADLDGNAIDPFATLELAIDEEANWRVHGWMLWDNLRLEPQAPVGARLDVRGLRIDRARALRRGPRHGVLTNPRPPAFSKANADRRDAVLFASWVPDEAMPVGEHLLATLARQHADSKIFVGINHGSCTAWEDAVRRSGLDVEIRHAPRGVTTNSDAAGFVAALAALRATEERFDLVWFGHTKGASSPTSRAYDRVRWTFEKRFWGRRDVIDGYFSDPGIGLFALNYIVPWKDMTFDADALERMANRPVRALSIVTISTFYVMRDETVRAFCETAPPSMYTDGVESFGGSRYFFEWGMPSFPLMLGLDPYIERGLGRTTLPGTRTLDATVWADERQNHALVREQLLRYRADPAGYETNLTGLAIEANEIELPPEDSRSRAMWVELAGEHRWITTNT